jgi:ParB family chromosome partitioning protein
MEIKIKLVENDLTARHARALLKLPNEELTKEVFDTVIKNELTVKKTEKLINDILDELESPQEDKKSNVKGTMGMRIYLNTIKQAFDTIIGTGIKAKYNEVDKGDYMEVVVRIPKK